MWRAIGIGHQLTYDICKAAGRDLAEAARDFKVTEQQEVPVIRLDALIAERGIGRIAYLHIDAQGSDLKVPQSVGEHLHMVERGCLECATSLQRCTLRRGAYLRGCSAVPERQRF